MTVVAMSATTSSRTASGARPALRPMKPGRVVSTGLYIDTHVHLDRIVESAAGEGASMALFSSTCLESGLFGSGFRGAVQVALAPRSIAATKELVKLHPTLLHPCWGLHPLSADEWTDAIGTELVELVSSPGSVGWGECGLDYFYDAAPRDVQMSVFEKQMRLATAVGKPLVVHARDAEEDTWNLMKKVLPDGYPVHLHCFTGTPEYAERMLSTFPGLKIGLTGALTFKTASHLREVAGRIVPPHRLLLETDGPFMAPVPFRGCTSHPGMIPTIAAAVAEARREFGTDPSATVDSVLQETFQTAKDFYHI